MGCRTATLLLLAALAPVAGARAQTLPSVRTGLIATRGGIPNTFDATVTVAMSRSHHAAADRIRDLRIVIPNFYAQPGAEIVPPTAATVTCSVEYPAGTEHQCVFSGASSGTAPRGGYVVGVVAPLDIPAGAGFWDRQYRRSAGGIAYSTFPTVGSQSDRSEGDALALGSGAADQTMGGAIADSGSGGVMLPAALVGRTRLPSVILEGDSIAAGAQDAFTGTSSDLGSVARTLGAAEIAYVNLAVPGDTARGFGVHDRLRQEIFKYATHCVVELGSNDLADNRTAGEVKHDLAVIYDQCEGRGLQVLQTTITPRTASTDDWATVTGQTPIGAFTATGYAAQLNRWIRANPHGIAGHFEVAGAVEPGPGTVVWTADGTPFGPTDDGVHPSHGEYLAIEMSGAVDVTQIHR